MSIPVDNRMAHDLLPVKELARPPIFYPHPLDWRQDAWAVLGPTLLVGIVRTRDEAEIWSDAMNVMAGRETRLAREAPAPAQTAPASA